MSKAIRESSGTPGRATQETPADRASDQRGARPAAGAGAASGSKAGVKHFVLDTNVLLHNPNSLYMFDDNIVVIPFTVLGELDKFKKNNDDTGRSSREVIRQLDKLRAMGTLSKGVQWNGHGGMVKVEFADLSTLTMSLNARRVIE